MSTVLGIVPIKCPAIRISIAEFARWFATPDSLHLPADWASFCWSIKLRVFPHCAQNVVEIGVLMVPFCP